MLADKQFSALQQEKDDTDARLQARIEQCNRLNREKEELSRFCEALTGENTQCREQLSALQRENWNAHEQLNAVQRGKGDVDACLQISMQRCNALEGEVRILRLAQLNALQRGKGDVDACLRTSMQRCNTLEGEIRILRLEATRQTQKTLTATLGDEHVKCEICLTKYSTDVNSRSENVSKHLPVLSSSKSCDHWFCHGCILKEQVRIADDHNGKVPKWIPCMICRAKTAFCPSEPKYHRMLIGLLEQTRWIRAPTVKEEPSEKN